MKRSELLKLLKKNGVVFVRHGSRHDIYLNPKNGLQTAVPRHDKEMRHGMAEKILKDLQL